MALEGTLQDMSLTDLFGIFQMGNKSGTLNIWNDTEQGVIYVYNGQLVDAKVYRKSQQARLASSEQAVLHLLGWAAGSFVFTHDPKAASYPVTISHTSDWLIATFSGKTSDLTAETTITLGNVPAQAEKNLELNMSEWRLLAAVGAGCTIGVACATVRMHIDQALKITESLVKQGLLLTSMPALQAEFATPVFQPFDNIPTKSALPVEDFSRTTPASVTTANPAAMRKTDSSLLKAIIRRVQTL